MSSQPLIMQNWKINLDTADVYHLCNGGEHEPVTKKNEEFCSCCNSKMPLGVELALTEIEKNVAKKRKENKMTNGEQDNMETHDEEIFNEEPSDEELDLIEAEDETEEHEEAPSKLNVKRGKRQETHEEAPKQAEAAAPEEDLNALAQKLLSNPKFKDLFKKELNKEAPTHTSSAQNEELSFEVFASSTNRENFVEFQFNKKPDAQTLKVLKDAMFRWNPKTQRWWGPGILLQNNEIFGESVEPFINS